MSADLIIYCLENLTDYHQFERLCHDLMANNGYTNIEPLGGSKDKGRDALHVSLTPNKETTVFAYSVREDWRKKLDEDCEKIQWHGHTCDRVAFLCTADFTASERDNAIDDIKTKFGWTLELYGLERLRVMIDSAIIARHPQIFCPPFFPQAGGVSLSFSRDYLVLDFADDDEALGTWLARRLTLAGYLVWCRTLAPIAGSSLNDTIESLIRQRAFRFLPILSPVSVSDPDLTARRAFAAREADKLLLPLVSEPFDTNLLDRKSRDLEPVYFDKSWADGLFSLIDVLDSDHCPRSPAGGEAIALRSFMPTDLVTAEPETIYSNQFSVIHCPNAISRFVSKKPFGKEDFADIQNIWAFRSVNSTTLLAFHPPPEPLGTDYNIQSAGRDPWRYVETINSINARDLAIELINKSNRSK